MESVFNFRLGCGMPLGTGDIMAFCEKLSMSTYSSNVKLILLPVKFTDESRGVTLSNTGGIESLAPPMGGTTFAQPGLLITVKQMSIAKTRNDISVLKCINRLQT